MYRYIIKNKGLYSVYAILLVVSSTMSVFFAFVLSEIMNCAAEGNLQRLMRVLIVGIVFLLVTVFSEFFYGITKNKLICKARQDLINSHAPSLQPEVETIEYASVTERLWHALPSAVIYPLIIISSPYLA